MKWEKNRSKERSIEPAMPGWDSMGYHGIKWASMEPGWDDARRRGTCLLSPVMLKEG